MGRRLGFSRLVVAWGFGVCVCCWGGQWGLGCVLGVKLNCKALVSENGRVCVFYMRLKKCVEVDGAQG